MSSKCTPLIICVGAQKAGTSWLYKCLEEHEDICAASGKETNFFLQSNTQTDLDYKKLFSHCQNPTWFFESSPLYLYDKMTPNHVLNYDQNVKVIIILRNPVARTISHYRHLYNNKKISNGTGILEAVEQFPELLSNSTYKENVNNYIEVFKRSNVMVLNFEEISKNPQGVIDKVAAFCEIKSFTPRFLKQKYNTSLARSNPLYRRATVIYTSLNRSYFGRTVIATLRKLNIKSDNLERALSKTSSGIIPVSKQEETVLCEKLRDEIEFYNTFQYD